MRDHNAELINAAADGRIQVVRKLLERGANIDAANRWGSTALTLAAWWGHSETVQLLLDRGAKIEAADRWGNTALILAAGSGHSEIVQLLLARGANIEAAKRNGSTALMLAAVFGHSETVQLLLDRGAIIEAVDQYRRTALIRAAVNGHSETVQLLLDHGANIEAADRWRQTALILAARGGHREAFQLLASYGANAPVANVFCSKIRVSLSMIKNLRDRVERYCKVINCEFSLNNFFVAIEFLHLLNMRHNQMTAQICEKICFRLQLMQAMPRQNIQACLSAVKNNTALMLAFVFSENNEDIKRNTHLRGILNTANIRISILQYCGNPLPDLDKQSQIALCQKVPSLSILSGAVTNVQRMVRRLHKKQILAAVTPAAVSASIAACLFAAIPHLGIIAVLPAVLVLVAGIAISIAAPLIIRANTKRAHMQCLTSSSILDNTAQESGRRAISLS